LIFIERQKTPHAIVQQRDEHLIGDSLSAAAFRRLDQQPSRVLPILAALSPILNREHVGARIGQRAQPLAIERDDLMGEPTRPRHAHRCGLGSPAFARIAS
jgi:hypothetical protein